MSEHEELWDAFIRDTAPLVAQVGERLLALERSLESLGEEWREVMGLLHTIKGNCGMMQVERGEELAHSMERRARGARDAPIWEQARMLGPLISSAAGLEDVLADKVSGDAVQDLIAGLDAAEEDQDGDSTSARRAAAQAVELAGVQPGMSHVRIDAEVLDRFLELVGELVICYRRVCAEAEPRQPARARDSREGTARAADGGRAEPLELLGKHVGELRQRVLDARLVPLQVLVTRLKRLVRDLATATGKPLSFRVEGEDTVVDKSIADQLGEPLIHLIRNAVDHGIEAPSERRAAGKPDTGQVELHISTVGADVMVDVRDDGQGLSRKRLEAAATKRGIDTSGWTDRRVEELIFRPEFTTAEKVTRLSGRGVGMPQIKRTIERMGGELQFQTKAGLGSQFSIRVPLAAAIRRTLVVSCGSEEYAVPIESVLETFRVTPESLYPVDRGWVTSWRERVLPAQYLATQLGGRDQVEAADAQLCVVVEDGRRYSGLIVDDVSGQQDVVVRDLDPVLGRPRGVAGMAIVGEGRIAMVLDPRSLPWSEGRAAYGHMEAPA